MSLCYNASIIFRRDNILQRMETEYTGLSYDEVKSRVEAGRTNEQPESLTPTVDKIVKKNVFTLFNLINVVIAVALFLVGSPENTLFLGVALINTVMGIVQELRAKKTLDELSILAKAKASVIRDGKIYYIDLEDLVIDDIVYVSTGTQISTDSEVLSAEGLELDESLLTGEPNSIKKDEGATLMSGSFVTGIANLPLESKLCRYSPMNVGTLPTLHHLSLLFATIHYYSPLL